jgi:hypothetical protein
LHLQRVRVGPAVVVCRVALALARAIHGAHLLLGVLHAHPE